MKLLIKDLEGKYFRKVRILIYTDRRGVDIIKDRSYKNYIERLGEEFEVRKMICPRKWTTIIDFLEYYDSINRNDYDLIVLHVGIVDFSPRRSCEVKKIYKMKKYANIIFPKSEIKKYLKNNLGSKHEGEDTNNLYSLDMARNYLIHRLRCIPNLVWINSNRFIKEHKGNYPKKRPDNIDLVEGYNNLFSSLILNVVDLRVWGLEEVRSFTYDGIHPNKFGSDYIYTETKRIMESFFKCAGYTRLENLIGKPVSGLLSKNYQIKREKNKEKPLYILGSGPSLALFDIRKLKNCETMTFNCSYIAFRDWGFSPTYFAGVDTLVNNENKKEYKNLINKNEIKRFFFSRDPGYESYLTSKRTSFVDVEDDPLNPNLNFNTFLKVGNSGLFGLQVAIGILGFKVVYLIGCDANYEEIVPGVEIVDGVYNVKENKDINHFRKDYFGKGTRYNKPGTEKWHYQAWKNFYLTHIKNNNLGVKIYNLSPISKLSFFKKVEINNLLIK